MDPKIEIEFDNTSKTYLPGENVEGRVIIISTGSEYPISGIILRMEGKRVALINPQNPEEFYFLESRLTLLESDNTLPIDGMLEYSFLFKLPSELPSFFEVSRASIQYHLILTLKRRSDFDLTVKSPFYVNGQLRIDSLDEKEYNTPVEIRQSKSTGCFSCFNWRKSPRFGITVKLLKSVFLPGESIAFSLFIWNTSDSPLDFVNISFVRELRILDSGNFHTVLKEYGVLCNVKGPGVKPRSKITWPSTPADNDHENPSKNESPNLLVPDDVPPTHLGCKKFIELNYFVKIFIEPIGMCSSALITKIPVIILSSLNDNHD